MELAALGGGATGGAGESCAADGAELAAFDAGAIGGVDESCAADGAGFAASDEGTTGAADCTVGCCTALPTAGRDRAEATCGAGEACAAVMAGAGAGEGPPTCATVLAELPAGQVEHGALTTVDLGGGAVMAAIAARLAAEMPETLAKRAMDGMADPGAAKVVEPEGHASQGTVTVCGGNVVTVMVGAGVRAVSAAILAEEAAFWSTVIPDLDASLWIDLAALEGQTIVVDPVGRVSHGIASVLYCTGGLTICLLDCLPVAAATAFDAADWAAEMPLLFASAAIDEAAVAGHWIGVEPPSQMSHGAWMITMVGPVACSTG